ncbi:tetratricopeptide repeat protein [Sulfurovum sp.]|uniref:tetratricopeptide repeat protein n=1 Tax=Sulfurovum sp. TaxID=1969726 RepID=UPI0035645FA8
MTGIKFITKLILISLIFSNVSYALEDIKPSTNTLIKKPLIERYVFDELKALRTDQQKLREDVTKQITKSELSVSDRAIAYATDTINNIFYIIAAASSILLIVGLKSLKELKENSKQLVETKILKLSKDFEERLVHIESKAKQRFELIVQTQEHLEQTEKVNALWRRLEVEESTQEKLHLYDEILKVSPACVEALTYKAHTLLDLNEPRWALSLCDQVITLDDNYALSYWQRARANAELGDIDEAISDIKLAIEIVPSLQDELKNENSFDILSKNKNFIKLLT